MFSTLLQGSTHLVTYTYSYADSYLYEKHETNLHKVVTTQLQGYITVVLSYRDTLHLYPSFQGYIAVVSLWLPLIYIYTKYYFVYILKLKFNFLA